MSEEKEFYPEVDVEKAAAEVKALIDREKMNHVDYSVDRIEIYPAPKDENLPELCAFAAQWEEVFAHGDLVTGEDGERFPHASVARFEEALSRVSLVVNADSAFWKRIHEEIVPLYDRASDYDEWKKRWLRAKIWYDPVAINIQTTRVERVKGSGEERSREPFSKRTLPPGFVVSIL
jgi:hypothetical protein